jgi:hypothetical protein
VKQLKRSPETKGVGNVTIWGRVIIFEEVICEPYW